MLMIFVNLVGNSEVSAQLLEGKRERRKTHKLLTKEYTPATTPEKTVDIPQG